MSAIDVGQIEIEGMEEISKILDIEVCAKKNNHAIVFIKGMVEECWDILLKPLEERQITLRIGKTIDDVIFCGIIRKVDVYSTEEGDIVEVYGTSASIYLDEKRKKRSFQNPDYTGKDIIREVLRGTKDAAVIFQMPDIRIGKPVIQYEETDWEFILRIASLCHVSVYVDFYSGKPWIYCGLPEEKEVREMDVISYSWGKSDGFLFRQLDTYCQCRLGERVAGYDGLRIQELSCKLKKGLLEYRYDLRPKEYANMDAYYNRRLSGIYMKGKVIDTKEEFVKVHLDMDAEQEAEEACWYKWLPETGNVFYCVPEIGARIYLHIEGNDERQAAAVGCIHEDYKGDQDRYNQENRSLVFDTKKKIGLMPEMLNISNQKERRLDINIEDKEGLRIDSFGEVNLFAGETIGLKGKRIFFQATEEISMVRKSLVQSAVINMGNRFDILGRYAEVEATGETIAMMPVISCGNKEEYSLNQIENAVLASTPIDGAGMDCEIGRLALGSKVHRINMENDGGGDIRGENRKNRWDRKESCNR